MSNLIPTPRADKNGKVVTRHIKNQATGAVPVSIPAPQAAKRPMGYFGKEGRRAATASKTEKGGSAKFFARRKRKRAITALVDTLFPNKSDVIWGASANTVRRAAENTLTTEEILMARDLAQLVNRSGVSRESAADDTKRLIWSLLREQADVDLTRIRVRVFHSHRDWLEEHPGEANKLFNAVEKLIELDMISDNGANGINYLDEYMAGINHPSFENYDIIYIWRKDYLNAVVRHPDKIDNIVSYFKIQHGFKEDGFEDFLRSATNHPEEIDRMTDYMGERGGFDEDGFEEYLNAATPLADGAL